MNREDLLLKIEGFCGKNREDINFRDILIYINNTRPAPMSFYLYSNLCTFDSRPHWNLEEDGLMAQSDECLAFITGDLKD